MKGEQNKTEAAYDAHLAQQLQFGLIAWYRWNPGSLKLAKGVHYQIDFLVMQKDGELQIHETKGHMEDDAWVKLKLLATIFPIPVKLVRQVKGERRGEKTWHVSEVGVDATAEKPAPQKLELQDCQCRDGKHPGPCIGSAKYLPNAPLNEPIPGTTKCSAAPFIKNKSAESRFKWPKA